MYCAQHFLGKFHFEFLSHSHHVGKSKELIASLILPHIWDVLANPKMFSVQKF